MSCNTCKQRKKEKQLKEFIPEIKSEQPKTPFLKKVKDFTVKIIIFSLLCVFLTPIVIIAYFITLFNIVILSKNINILPLVYYIGNKIFKNKNDEDEDEDDDDDDDDDEDDEEYDEEDYELENPNDIIVLK
jgi:hypothetical protein